MNLISRLFKSFFKKEKNIKVENQELSNINIYKEKDIEIKEDNLEIEVIDEINNDVDLESNNVLRMEVVESKSINSIDFKKYNSFILDKLKTLNNDQNKLFNEIKLNNKLNICIPTGAGKGYLMMVDLLDRIINSDEKVFVISSHRLMLNEQHMDDVVELLGEMIGDVGFLFVGSSPYKQNKFNNKKDWKRKLLKRGVSYKDLFYSTTKKIDIFLKIKEHISNGRKVVISTTYHSMDRLNDTNIDTIYCDEAHILASEKKESSDFSKNFKSLMIKNEKINTYFFTATPKDCTDEIEDTFLMNNKDIFGERTGLSFKECVEAGYITQPIVHLAYPNEFKSIDIKDYVNMAKFIIETHKSHSKFIKESSISPNDIDAKILVKCPGVPEMWNIFEELLRKTKDGNLDITIAAGASSKRPNNKNSYYIGDDGYNKNDYLTNIQKIEGKNAAIVLHYDTMSEGINVSGFTGTEFISEDLPSKPKLLQNIGRSTRLHKEDRDNIKNGLIDTKDYSKWIKPHNAVIIPFWNTEGEGNSKKIAKTIKKLRDELGFDPAFRVSIGSDISSAGGKDDPERLNKENNTKLSKIIDEIKNEIEELDKISTINEEEDRLRSLSKLDLLKEKL
jgi:hypothetical protein